MVDATFRPPANKKPQTSRVDSEELDVFLLFFYTRNQVSCSHNFHMKRTGVQLVTSLLKHESLENYQRDLRLGSTRGPNVFTSLMKSFFSGDTKVRYCPQLFLLMMIARLSLLCGVWRSSGRIKPDGCRLKSKGN